MLANLRVCREAFDIAALPLIKSPLTERPESLNSPTPPGLERALSGSRPYGVDQIGLLLGKISRGMFRFYGGLKRLAIPRLYRALKFLDACLAFPPGVRCLFFGR